MATAWCRVWWPRGRLQPVPPARFVLFGWLFARTSSVDVLVATALPQEEILLSFPTLEALQTRIQAICGFPLLAKDAEFVSKIADILGQLLASEENVEHDAVHKALMSLIRQDVKSKLLIHTFLLFVILQVYSVLS
uniref:Uncharacterized protein n=1 Tax=Oryza brachyantha TaxID=4533 RepID=J3M5L7_ORYBR